MHITVGVCWCLIKRVVLVCVMRVWRCEAFTHFGDVRTQTTLNSVLKQFNI